MKRVLITGSHGSLGSAVTEVIRNDECKSKEYELILTASRPDSEKGEIKLDISDAEEVLEVVEKYQPDIIVNCAAFTAVDLCEDETEKAYKINAQGPRFLAEAAERANSLLIHVSTDYVYDGKGVRPYTEEDKVEPVSVYGASKLQGDRYVLECCKKHFVLRTAWLYGKGKSFVTTMLRLAENGQTVRVVNDQLGTPTSALELARAIVYLFDKEEYGVYNTVCEGTATWFEFAKKIFEFAGKDVDLQPITTAEFKTRAVRPAYSVLDMSKWKKQFGHSFKTWEDALAESMK